MGDAPGSCEEERHQTFPRSSGSARRARDWARPLLLRWGFDGVTPEVLLVLTELVSNAVRHGRGSVRVALANWHDDDGGDHVRLEVADDAPERLPLVLAKPGAVGGRGLVLVRELSSAWGIEYGNVGKTVWAEVDV